MYMEDGYIVQKVPAKLGDDELKRVLGERVVLERIDKIEKKLGNIEKLYKRILKEHKELFIRLKET